MPLDPAAIRRFSPAKPARPGRLRLSPTISRVLQDGEFAPLLEKATELASLGNTLIRVLPAALASRCQVANLQGDGVLVIQVSSNAVAAKLRAVLPRLHQAIASTHPGVLQLLVQVRPASLPEPPPPPHPRLLDATAAAHLEALADSLGDTPLRRAIRRLAAKGQALPPR
jgi:hypothetical protein